MKDLWFFRKKHLFCLLAVLLLASFPVHRVVSDEVMELPVKLQFKLLITASTYNRFENSTDPAQIHVGIIHPGDSISKEMVSEILETFGKPNTTFRKYKLQISPILFEGFEQLKEQTLSNHIQMYYITPGSQSYLSSIMAVSKSLKILTTTGVRDYIYSGITLGVVNQGARPEFLFNRNAAEHTGVDFNSNFLRMVHVVNQD
ncbi:MAG: YfiR family protein [SAR324 cluster bacterium]|nr:YfiR family protein [SAR324 cluster bacterium]